MPAFDGTASGSSDSGVTAVFERKLNRRPFTNSTVRDVCLVVNTTDQRNNVRAWAIAKGINKKWVDNAQDYQLSSLYNSTPYFNKILALKEEETYTGERSSSGTRSGRWTTTNRSAPRTFDRNTFTADDLDKEATIAHDDGGARAAVNEMLTRSLTSFEPTPNETTAAVDLSQMRAVSLSQLGQIAEEVIGPRLRTAQLTLESELDKWIKDAKLELGPQARAQLRELATTTARDVISGLIPQTVEIKNITTGSSVNVGLQHKDFPKLLKMCQARDHKGFRLNLWMTGPTGSGKTSGAESVAYALADQFTQYKKAADGTWTMHNPDGSVADLNGMSHDAPWAADSSLDADYKVVGHSDGYGKFHWTPFLRIFAFGGVYIADEIDNWAPSALIAMNAPLANGWISTPIGTIRRHKDCIIIAAANTWGFGATDDYVARRKLDAATVNRFPNKIFWDYDPKLERAIAMNMAGEQGISWCEKVQRAREAAKSAGIKVILSPRNTFEGISMIQAGFTPAEVTEMNLLAGLDPSQRSAIEGAIR